MKLKQRLWMVGLALGASAGLAQMNIAADEAAGKQWWAPVQVLADDSMRGRQTGSAEYLKAAALCGGAVQGGWTAASGR